MISGDVFEHIPFPEQAIRDSYRILKPGGCHIFTAPFYHHRFTNERRSSLRDDGVIEHHMKPWYHDDPMRPEGVLVFNIFAPELCCMLGREGFEVRLLKLHNPFYGIYRQNAIVLVTRKVLPAISGRDAVFMN
jgi:SAM-dependent methyltransferase